MRIERSGSIAVSPSRIWTAFSDWKGHADWQPSLVEVDAPDQLGRGTQLVEVRASHGQRLTFEVVIREWEEGRRIRASGKSRGVVSVSADLLYEVAPQGGGSQVTLAVEAEIPLILLPLRHAVQIEVEKELDQMLARLGAAYVGSAQAS
ncbi:MAG TPA: SRPBCC family protein [Candidatus Dormibacteraeota bacterium]